MDKLSTAIVDKGGVVIHMDKIKNGCSGLIYQADTSVSSLWIKCGKLIHNDVDKFLLKRLSIESNL